MMTETYVRARCLLLVGDEAEVTIPERGWRDPVRVPAAEIAEVSGMPRSGLAGAEFEVVLSGSPGDPVLSGWHSL